ncbi:hypothetical protein BJ165DRAFT_1530581 [Panaeolus papilionaceus]|nr:hypothetical protein BJ165DRAFT_1530581 [Panaeolus papilionaceus]
MVQRLWFEGFVPRVMARRLPSDMDSLRSWSNLTKLFGDVDISFSAQKIGKHVTVPTTEVVVHQQLKVLGAMLDFLLDIRSFEHNQLDHICIAPILLTWSILQCIGQPFSPSNSKRYSTGGQELYDPLPHPQLRRINLRFFIQSDYQVRVWKKDEEEKYSEWIKGIQGTKSSSSIIVEYLDCQDVPMTGYDEESRRDRQIYFRSLKKIFRGYCRYMSELAIPPTSSARAFHAVFNISQPTSFQVIS